MTSGAKYSTCATGGRLGLNRPEAPTLVDLGLLCQFVARLPAYQNMSIGGLLNVSQGGHRYLKANQVPHLWQVDTHGHDAEAWGGYLYHFAQRLFQPMGKF